MITVMFKCDRCGKEQDATAHDANVGKIMTLTVKDYRSTYSSIGWRPELTAMWCNECVEWAQLPTPRHLPNDKTPVPSFEEVLKDFIRNCIEEASK